MLFYLINSSNKVTHEIKTNKSLMIDIDSVLSFC